MVGILQIDRVMLMLLKTKTGKKRMIIIGLKSDNCSRETLLRLLASVVKSGDSVLAVHIQEPNDTFNPNTFHIHKDLCKSKRLGNNVNFQVKVCVGDSYISELSWQVRVNYATHLVLGCSRPRPKNSVVANCLKGLPPTCTLLVTDIGGRVIIQRRGTSQQGSTSEVLLRSSSPLTEFTYLSQPAISRQLHKLLMIPCSSIPSLIEKADNMRTFLIQKTLKVPEFMAQKLLQREAIRHFTPQELNYASNNFSPAMMIGLGGYSDVYRAHLEDGQAVAVKVLKTTHRAANDLLKEVNMLTNLSHENIVQIFGYCYCKELQAVVYNLLSGSLKQKLKQLRWNERMGIAIGVAKALEYLHHSCNPPIIHRDVKLPNILLSDNCQPQLSDFGAALIYHESQRALAARKPFNVIGTFGYLAPEYMMYGKVDEKIVVYSYGVVLLELITGKEALETNQADNESLVLWASCFLRCGQYESLIDSYLIDYQKEELEIMIFAARLCLMHSASRRPTMEVIVRLLEKPEYWLRMQKVGDHILSGIGPKSKVDLWELDDAVNIETVIMDNDLR